MGENTKDSDDAYFRFLTKEIDEYLPNKGCGIYHYCTKETMKKICESGKLRFTFVKKLDDSTEFINLIEVLKKVCKESLEKEEISYDFFEIIQERYIATKANDYDQSYLTITKEKDVYRPKYDLRNVFSLSLTYKYNDKTMWEKYAKNKDTGEDGVNLQFDETFIIKNYEDYTFFRGSIIYSDDEKEKSLRRLILDSSNIWEKYRDKSIDHIIRKINELRIFFKECKYSAEDEFRIAVLISKKEYKENFIDIPFEKQYLTCINERYKVK